MTPIKIIEAFVPPAEATDWFHSLWNDLAWERREQTPRREYWTNCFNRSYTYGRGRGVRTYESNVSHPIIDKATEMLSNELGFIYEGCFLNGYESKKDALGFHADDDPNIDHSRPIAIVTPYSDATATPRVIQFREVINPGSETERAVFGDKETVPLSHGSLVLMLPGMQQTHQHQIPKAAFESKPRISLTFRGLFAD